MENGSQHNLAKKYIKITKGGKNVKACSHYGKTAQKMSLQFDEIFEEKFEFGKSSKKSSNCLEVRTAWLEYQQTFTDLSTFLEIRINLFLAHVTIFYLAFISRPSDHLQTEVGFSIPP